MHGEVSIAEGMTQVSSYPNNARERDDTQSGMTPGLSRDFP